MTARGQPGGQRAFISSISLGCYVQHDHNDHDEAQQKAERFPVDKTRARGIMKIQKGAVDLTVGPNDSTQMLTARGSAGRSTSFYSSISFWCYVQHDHNDHDEAKQKAKKFPLIHKPHLPSQGSGQPPFNSAYPFARIAPVASFEVGFILTVAPCFVNSRHPG